MTNDERTSLMKLKGFDYWKQTLKGAKFVLAPMVDQSALAWRILARRNGCDLAYTPMYNARAFTQSATMRAQFATCAEDRPLIVQFAGDDPDLLLQAAKMVEDQCDGIDLNLGCPQHIAKRGHYGSYLQDEWELLERIVTKLNAELKVPVSCKIRIFDSVEKSIAYAQMLEKAGCQLLTVHGRTREQKGHNTGLADWQVIRRIRESVSIPVFANGNILYHRDILNCLEQTGCQGVMSAEGHLYNPRLFMEDTYAPTIVNMVDEYLRICEELKPVQETPLHMIRCHLFKIYKPCLEKYSELRNRMGAKHMNWDQLKEIIELLRESLNKDMEEAGFTAEKPYNLTDLKVLNGIEQLPHWVCQPYTRPPPVFTPKDPKVAAALAPLMKRSNSVEEDDQKRPKLEE